MAGVFTPLKSLWEAVKKFTLMIYIPLAIIWIVSILGGRILSGWLTDGLMFIFNKTPNIYNFAIGLDVSIESIATVFSFVYYATIVGVFLKPVAHWIGELWRGYREAKLNLLDPTFNNTVYNFLQINKRAWLFIRSLRGLAIILLVFGLIQANYFLYENNVHHIRLDTTLENINPALWLTAYVYAPTIGGISYGIIWVIAKSISYIPLAGALAGGLDDILNKIATNLILEVKKFLMNMFRFNLKPTIFTFATSLELPKVFGMYFYTYLSTILKITLGLFGIIFARLIGRITGGIFGFLRRRNPFKKTVMGGIILPGTIEDSYIQYDIETDHEMGLVELLTLIKTDKAKRTKWIAILYEVINEHDDKILRGAFKEKLESMYGKTESIESLIKNSLDEIIKRHEGA